jgi:hypothetical protein
MEDGGEELNFHPLPAIFHSRFLFFVSSCLRGSPLRLALDGGIAYHRLAVLPLRWVRD